MAIKVAVQVSARKSWKNSKYTKERTSNKKLTKELISYWERFNKSHFKGKLTKPQLVVKTSIRVRDSSLLGYWAPDVNLLVVDERVMTVAPEHLKKYTILHEMCHQAVSELEGNPDEDSHGPVFMSWCDKINIEPAAANYNPSNWLNTESEIVNEQDPKIGEALKKGYKFIPWRKIEKSLETSDMFVVSFYDKKDRIQSGIVLTGDKSALVVVYKNKARQKFKKVITNSELIFETPTKISKKVIVDKVLHKMMEKYS